MEALCLSKSTVLIRDVLKPTTTNFNVECDSNNVQNDIGK